LREIEKPQEMKSSRSKLKLIELESREQTDGSDPADKKMDKQSYERRKRETAEEKGKEMNKTKFVETAATEV
jgi:hypothetical protein